MSIHVVAWNFKPEIKEEDKPALLSAMKLHLENLVGQVPGLCTAKFIDAPLPGSSREFCLMTTHVSNDAIAAYAADPKHNAVADSFVRPYTCDRISINFE